MKKINPNLYPKGSGYKFKEPDGTIIVGGTWEGVIARVTAYRKRNNLPPGNPREEVVEQACANNPGSCTEDNELAKAQLKVSTLKGRMLAWFAHLRGKPRNYVDAAEASRRASICKRCPYRKAIVEGCSSCRAAMVQLRLDILGQGRAADPELVQNGCVILGTDLATAVHLEQITTENPELPAECWRKKSL